MAVGRAAIAVIGLLAIYSIPSRSFAQEPAALVPDGEHRIPFQPRNGLIYIQAQVNGRRTTLLLDTGAALTTFSLKIAPTTSSDSRILINMAKGSVTAFRIPVGFTLGDSDVKKQRCSFRQVVVVGDFKFGDAEGVIGLDVLSLFKSVTLDFKNSMLILEDH
jgi:hypothetical protein